VSSFPVPAGLSTRVARRHDWSEFDKELQTKPLAGLSIFPGYRSGRTALARPATANISQGARVRQDIGVSEAWPKDTPMLLMHHRYQLAEIYLLGAIINTFGNACCL
jgi:hypothetical protein